MRVATSAILLALPVALIAACRHDVAEPMTDYVEPVAPRAANPAPLPPLSDELAAALRGRTIFLDAGHGGPFTGMVAPSNGVHEADVNLRVTLNLRDRLQARGATVHLSRTDDTVPIPDSLSRDLSARAAMSNKVQPEVFLSIHHNADVEAGSQKDDLEVYYKLGDSMASLDLGRSLVAALGRGIRFDAATKRLLPGNYKVLRENDAPSLLLETAYLTNNRDAAYLSTAQGVEDEARSIEYGLATYFASDPPKINRVVDDAEGSLRFQFAGGTPIDLNTIAIEVGGDPVDGVSLPLNDGFEWFPERPLPNGTTELVATGRNTRGAGFRVQQTVLRSRPPAAVQLSQSPSPAGPENRVRIAARVLDAHGMPVADGTSVAVDPIGDAGSTQDGVAFFQVETNTLPASVAANAGGISATLALALGDSAYQTVVLEDAKTGAPVSGANAFSANALESAFDRDGWAALPLNAGPLRIAKDGYEDMRYTPANRGHATLKITPRHGGALLGKRVAIDPAHGGRAPGARAFDGTRASDLNLDTAQRLAAMLKQSGADVFVTRAGDDEITDLHRIVETEAFGADLLVVLSFGAPVEEIRPLDPVGHLRRDLSAFVGHYPQSVNGIRAASAIADELRIPTTACVSYMVQQSQSAAIHVQPAALDISAQNNAPFDANAVRTIAEAMHRGLVEYFTGLATES